MALPPTDAGVGHHDVDAADPKVTIGSGGARHTQQMSWVFEGTLLPEGDVGRVILGAGEPQALPGRYALVGLVDAHCHVTVAINADEPYLDGCGAPARLDALAQSGVTTLRDVGGDRQVTLDLAPIFSGGLADRAGSRAISGTSAAIFPANVLTRRARPSGGRGGAGDR